MAIAIFMPRLRPGKTSLWLDQATKSRLKEIQNQWKGEISMDYILNDILDRLADVEEALCENPDLDQELEEETYPEDEE